VVLYEDAATRDAAVELCDKQVKKFGAELDFEFTWWGFKYLNDEEIGRQAASAAMAADLILVSVVRAEDLPLEVKAWFERWLSERQPSEGALVVLQTGADGRALEALRDPYLRLVALRAKLDYLPLTEGQLAPNGNDLSENLDLPRIIEFDGNTRQEDHYTGWGIND
jgi:hypothetical protein